MRSKEFYREREREREQTEVKMEGETQVLESVGLFKRNKDQR